MHSRLAFLLGSLSLAHAQSPDSPVINTPMSVVQCLPSQLTFHGGSPPYTISAIPAGQVGAAPLVELGSQNGDSMTWVANLPSGTAITLQIRDSKGVINYSQSVTIQPGSDDSCLKSGSGSSSGSTPPATTSPSTPTPPSVTTGVGSVNGSSQSSPSNTSSSTSRPANTSSTPTPNATASTTSSTNNQTKGPSPFTPNPSNNSTLASSSAPSSAAAPVASVDSRGIFTFLAFTAAMSVLIA